jgi:hypothetical protein
MDDMKKLQPSICMFLLFATMLLFTSCNTYYELLLENENPTEYCFDANVNQVKIAIEEGLGNYQIKGLALYFRQDNRFDILQLKGNENDAYLRTFLEPMKSKIYFKDNKALLYSADFHVHLDSLTENKTRVTVVTLKSEVSTGKKLGIGDNLTLGSSNLKSVPPSTIEEYEILLIIGKKLGQEGMPPCNYPSKEAKKVKRYNSIF